MSGSLEINLSFLKQPITLFNTLSQDFLQRATMASISLVVIFSDLSIFSAERLSVIVLVNILLGFSLILEFSMTAPFEAF